TMMEAINAQGRYACAYANIEAAQVARGNPDKGIPTVCSVLARSIEDYLGDDVVSRWWRDEGHHLPASDQLTRLLRHWSQQCSRPIVLFLDEVDALVGDT
ncbi:ATP-binding protein, partial [Ectothiorhodospira variabilis]|nr:ATP-binding protein [Ectothiorhodospira variabilis]